MAYQPNFICYHLWNPLKFILGKTLRFWGHSSRSHFLVNTKLWTHLSQVFSSHVIWKAYITTIHRYAVDCGEYRHVTWQKFRFSQAIHPVYLLKRVNILIRLLLSSRICSNAAACSVTLYDVMVLFSGQCASGWIWFATDTCQIAALTSVALLW